MATLVRASEPTAADLDGDRLFDNLATRLRKVAPTKRVEVIVTLRDRMTPARLRRLARGLGFDLGRRLPLIDAFSASVTRAQAEALAARGDVAHVQENVVMRALNDSAQNSFGVTKARLDLPTADGDADGNAASYSKGDVVAAVVDTGIDAFHQDLDGGKVIAFADCTGGACTSVAPFDDNGHGSHVAGVLAGTGEARVDGRYRGVAPRAALVGVKVLNNFGMGDMGDIIAGIDWVVDNKDAYGIEVLNLSIGQADCAFSRGEDAASAAVNAAFAAGLVVVVAAGNSGPDLCTVGTPAGAADALTVGAMADLGVAAGEGFGAVGPGLSLASFSSRGPTADGRIKPDVAAPGVAITSVEAGSVDGYHALSGTSMAAPFVAGVAALMLDVNSGLTSAQVKQKITTTAVDWARGGDNAASGSSGSDADYGAGRMDAYAAIKSAGAAIDSPPAAPPHVLLEGSLLGTGSNFEYFLEVTSTDVPIAATLITPVRTGESPDFDLQLFDPQGGEVATGETTLRQDELGHLPASTGIYTLRVSSFDGTGPYFIDLSGAMLRGPAPLLRHHATTTEDPVSAGGDGDGVIEPGDSFALIERVRNSGASEATGVSGTLTTSMPGLVVDAATSSYGSIVAGTTTANATPYGASLSSTAPCGATLGLGLELSSDQGTFAVPLRVPTGHASAPVARNGQAPIDLPDRASVDANLDVAATGLVKDLDVRIGEIVHTFDGDLTIELISPAGTAVMLINRRGANGNDLRETVLDDEAGRKVSSGAAPFTGSFRPEQPLSAFDGEQAQGTWTLRIVDRAGGDEGVLNTWGHSVSTAVCDPPPVAQGLSVSTGEDTAKAITLVASDIDSPSLTYGIVDGPSHGTLSGQPPNLIYTPAQNDNRPDSFRFKANDGESDSNLATVSIAVTPVNDPPTVADDAKQTPEDTTLNASVPAAADPDTGDAVTYQLVAGLAGLTFNPNGSYSFVPATNFHGIKSFTYRASDGTASSNEATVTITVAPVNDPPVAADDTKTTLEDTVLNASVPTASDVDGGPATYQLVTALPGVSFNPDGTYAYDPPQNSNGVVSFRYRANDGNASSNEGTLTITVTPVNDAPVAADDARQTPEETTLNALVPAALDVEGQALTYHLESVLPGLTFNPNGSYVYTPPPNFTGPKVFTYRASDGSLSSNIATVTITVTPQNDAPTAQAQTVTTSEDTAAAITLAVADADSTAFTYTVEQPDHGVLVGAAPNLTYMPDPNYAGADAFAFTANDGAAESNEAAVTINVTPVNDPPIALGDAFSVAHGTVLTVAAPGVLGNDFDVEGGVAAINAAGPSSGTLALNPNGSFTYAASAGFSGPDSFTYKVSDGTLESNPATVTIVVADAAPSPPPEPDREAPTDPFVESASHRVGVGSFDRTIDLSWNGAADGASGVDGFSFHWDSQPSSLPDLVKEVEETATGTTSPVLSNGSWYFHLRTRDNAGNWTATRHVGPFLIVSRAPQQSRCAVPSVKGKTLAQARRLLTARRCALGRVTRKHSANVKAGRVVWQGRRPGTRLPRGTRVALALSLGPRRTK